MEQTEQLARIRGLLDREEAAGVLKCGPQRIDKLRKTGALRARREGRAWRYTLDDLHAYIAGLPTSV